MPKQMMSFRKPFDALTVSELRKLLAELPDDAVILHTDWDSEWDHVYHYVLTGISPDGHCRFKLYDTNEDDDDA